jgi:hypothetical protein
VHPYRSSARQAQQPSVPRALPEGLSQIERAKLGLTDPQLRFWLVVTGLMLAFGILNAVADFMFRVIV